MKNEMIFEPSPRLPTDGTGTISVRDIGPAEDFEMEAIWEDGKGGRIVARGAGLPVIKWAFYQPSAETRLYHDTHEWVSLDQDRYDACATDDEDDEPDREP